MATRPGNGKTQKIVFKYEKVPDYRDIPVNGVWGGPTARGDIHMQLFAEYSATPVTVTHEISGNTLGPETRRDLGGATFTRHLLVGVLMSPQNARSIAQWLLGKAEEVERQLQEASNVVRQ